ncbi:TIGR03943 family putative permease subunit [Paenibacillus cymbidii]|uniref:TIGR03943 family putative permease subunit n=1 Tax=Paenibacillus cymbidii TaxID=1639034 RepID=UPI0010803480|nr:TIGR03943 family protein [Paenibacillus cymbidii]
MDRQIERRPQEWFRALILAALTGYIVYLTRSDHLHYFIAPRMQPYVKYAALACFVLAAHQIYVAWRRMTSWEEPDACGCEHPHSRSALQQFVTYGLFVVPLLLGFLLPDTLLGSAAAANKGMNLTASAAVKPASAPAVSGTASRAAEPTSASPVPVAEAGAAPSANPSAQDLDELFPADKYTEDYARLAKKLYALDRIVVPEDGYMETLSSVDLYDNRFVGKKMQLSGFVYRESLMSPDQFAVGRMAMSCCSADASPFGVMIESAMNKSFANDTWVNVTGTIAKTTYNHKEIMVLHAESISKIAAPASAYIYPNYQYLLE